MAEKDPNKPGRLKQVLESYRMTKQSDPRIGLILLGTFVLVALGGFALTYLVLDALIVPIVFGVLFGTLGVLIVFGRRAQTAALSSIEGQPGASVAALSMLRRGWQVERNPIGFTKQQDVVFRVVGPPGIILVAEGNVNRVRPLLTDQRRKHERVVSEVAIHEVLVGDGPGEVPLRKLVRHVSKLGRNLKPAQMTDVLARLKALDATRSNIPLPKGPVPTSMKGARGNLRGR